MNPSEPSFLRLFRRSHYCRPLPVDDELDIAVEEREERERFAVAALALCLKYDRVLLKHFWQRVCQVPGDPKMMPDIAPSEILLEPPHWADLRLVSDNHTRRFVWVIEVKAGTHLEKRQRPDRPAVFMRPGHGYGALFADEEKRRGTNMRFVILGARPDDNLEVSLGAKRVAPIVLQQRTWQDLADGFPRTQLCKDLAIWLGNLGIRAFPAAEMKNMKVNTTSLEIGKAVTILHDVQSRLDWPDNARAGLPSFDVKDGWWMGRHLFRAETSNPARLNNLLQPPARYVAFFGYQGGVGGTAELVVELYCGSKEAQQSSVARLRKVFARGAVEECPPDKNWFNVIVKARTHSLNNDSDWFCSVFKQLGLRVRE